MTRRFFHAALLALAASLGLRKGRTKEQPALFVHGYPIEARKVAFTIHETVDAISVTVVAAGEGYEGYSLIERLAVSREVVDVFVRRPGALVASKGKFVKCGIDDKARWSLQFEGSYRGEMR